VPRALPAIWIFVGIGLAGGFFSALFGVGGGVIIVPLLVLLVGWEPGAATGTSLAVIGLTAVFGVAAFSALGEVHWRDAATVGLPAVAGVLLGTWLQQRVPSGRLVLLFAVLLTAVAIRLLV